MVEAIFLLIGVFAGAFLGRFFFGRNNDKIGVGEKETCAYWCGDVKHSKTCDKGDSGKCLDDLIGKCLVS
jgi:hypothetical protein